MINLELVDGNLMDKGTYLCSNSTMLINPSLAFLINDSDTAIILQQLHYWLEKNKEAILLGKKYTKNGKEIPNMYRDGRIWCFNTFEDWEKEFIWISLSSIKRKISALEDMGIIISTDKYNVYNGDRTKWYSIDYRKLVELEDGLQLKMAEKIRKITARQEKQKKYNQEQNSKNKTARLKELIQNEEQVEQTGEQVGQAEEAAAPLDNTTKCQNETMAKVQNGTMAKDQDGTMPKGQNESLINNRLPIPETNLPETTLPKANSENTNLESSVNQSLNQSIGNTQPSEGAREELLAAQFILTENIKIQDFKGSADIGLIDEIGLNIMEMYMQSSTKVKDEFKPKLVVQSVLSKLKTKHIEYIVEKFKDASARTRISNKKGYLQSLIYNSVFDCEAALTSDIINDTCN